MKKSDLTRRAERDAKRAYKGSTLYQPDHEDAHAYGFEAGYRAARADLRRLMLANTRSHAQKSSGAMFAGLVGGVWFWLRPMR